MAVRLLLTVVSALLVGLVWQGDGLAQDKKDSGGKTTSSRSDSKPAAASSTRSKSTGISTKKKKPPSGGGGSASPGAAQKPTTSAGSADRRTRDSDSTAGTKKPLPASTDKRQAETTERARGAPAGKGVSLDESLSERKDGAPPPNEEEAASPGELDAPAEGGTSTTQSITAEELDEFIEENPNSQVQDADGDGDYEIVVDLDDGSYDGASVTVEDGYAYVDTNGDGSVDAVVPSAYYDPETNEIHFPVDPDSLSLSDDTDVSFDYQARGYVLEDRDGDGVPETYIGTDYDNDGIADVVEYREVKFPDEDRPVFGNVEASVENGPSEASDLPFNTRDEEVEPDPDLDPDENERPRGTARVNLFGGGGGAPTQPAALPADDVTRALTDLKSLYDKGLLPDSQYEIMQGQALAALDPRVTGVESGLQMLRGFWDQGLISADPYAAKRKEYLDAL